MPLIEATKSKEFYMEDDEIKTREPVDLAKSIEHSKNVTNIPVTFTCWECDPTHIHFFHQDWKNWNLECNSCGKKFHDMIDVTGYKEVVK